jgi:hypothetical protein
LLLRILAVLACLETTIDLPPMLQLDG